MNKIEELKQFVIDKNLGECLSPKWINCKTKYKWMCKNGHEFEKLWSAIKNKLEWCKHCVKVQLSTLQEFATKNDGALLSTEYINNKTKLSWKCCNNHTFEVDWIHISRRPYFCLECPKNDENKKYIMKPEISKKKITIVDCNESAIEFEGKCLETEYVNRRTPMRWMCKNNHIFVMNLGSVKYGKRWCRLCAHSSFRHDISIAHELAEKYGGECLSTEYVNLETPMKWRCKEGHEWEVRMSNIKGSGSWCRLCHLRTRRDKSIERVFKYVKILGGKILTKKEDIPYEIQANTITINIKCNKNHSFTRTFESLQHGSWCPDCFYKSESACRDIFESIYTYKFPKRRLECMDRLELDGYCDELGIAFEYDGLQHSEYVSHFHRNGMDDLLDQMSRDEKTDELCAKNGIVLIRIPHNYSYIERDKMEEFIFKELEKKGF